jgi:hypothetical protein
MPDATLLHNSMVRNRFLRSAAVALCAYGLLGLAIAAAMLVIGVSTFEQVTKLQKTLETERQSLVQSIRSVSGTLKDTSTATTNFEQSIVGARNAANQASQLANTSAGTFRSLGTTTASISVLGIQPLATLAPQFNASADQLQQLAITLGATRDSLAQNGTDVQSVGTDLRTLQVQLDAVATSLNQPGVLGLDAQSLLPFQLAFYGMCLLVIVQSAFSIVAGVALFRLQRALGGEALFPHINQTARTATTSDVAGHGHVRVS